MNRFATIFSASALSALAFGAESYAATPTAGAVPDSGIENTIQTMSSKHFSIVHMDKLKAHDAANEHFGGRSPTSPEARLVQASVIANHPLASKLQAQHVEVTKIVGADQAADGRVTFYIR